jgi:hypothetical protein
LSGWINAGATARFRQKQTVDYSRLRRGIATRVLRYDGAALVGNALN